MTTDKRTKRDAGSVHTERIGKVFTHLRFRRRLDSTTLAQLPLRMPYHPDPTVFGIVCLAAITVTTFFVKGLTYTVPTFAILLGALSLWYLKARRRHATE